MSHKNEMKTFFFYNLLFISKSKYEVLLAENFQSIQTIIDKYSQSKLIFIGNILVIHLKSRLFTLDFHKISYTYYI